MAARPISDQTVPLPTPPWLDILHASLGGTWSFERGLDVLIDRMETAR